MYVVFRGFDVYKKKQKELPGRECSEQFARKFQKKVGEVFHQEALDKLAIQTGFKERKSKLSPAMFVDTVLFKEVNNGQVSLEDHCVALMQRYGVSIRKQSLDERFDESAVNFILGLLKAQLACQINSAVEKEKLNEMLQYFSSVKIKDSTRFQISEFLKEYFPGSSGAASGAGIHIQFEFDIINGTVHDLKVTDALRQDQTDAKDTKHSVKKNELIIRDLGYFATDVLKHIADQEAFFISRISPGTNLYDSKTGKLLKLKKLDQEMRKKELTHLEILVLVGESKLPARLILEAMPQEQINKRLAKAEREAKKKGRTLSQEYKSRARLNLFITNIPVEWVPTDQVRKIYQLRWQIELRFKAWKSFYDLAATKKMQRYRFECYLYSTLLLIMINWEIAVNFFSILFKHADKPLSLLKFFKTTSQYIGTLRTAVMEKRDHLLYYLRFLYQVSFEKLLTEKKKNHSAPLEEILMQQID